MKLPGLVTPGELRARGILGMNARNTSYMLRWNPRRYFPGVDDKLRTKQLCARAGVPTAKLLGLARLQAELPRLMASAHELDSFVLKPARGAMGNGILVVREREGDLYHRARGDWIDDEAIRYHASSIISGLYALGGHPDVAMLEERLEVHPELAAIAADGVPDVRIVVYRGVPVMAMTRLPTHASRGRANLHQGAVGAGIDLGSGLTTRALLDGAPCRRHPDTNQEIVGWRVPAFPAALEIAVRASDETRLGYVGADVVVDASRGPVLLELNARPGLGIQLANGAGLLPRLREVDERIRPAMSLEERLELGRSIARGDSLASPVGAHA